MKPRLIDLESTTKAIRPYLEQYLQEQGIDTSKHFHCVNPKHRDSTESMTCKQVPERAFCFGCNYTADIFAAAHCLEGKPMKGPDFVNENILYLAKKYGIQVKLADLTQEEMYEYRTYQAYKLAADMIADPEFGDYTIVDKEIERRGWDKSKLVEWGIGTVNFQEFKDRLKKAGYEPKFLGGVDLDRKNLFNENNMLFTVYDDHGRPVGFSAKNLAHKPDVKTSGPKYINTRGTGLECAIFKKGERLYGYEIAKDAPEPLYMFEGQADVITARHSGMMNCCCSLGTAITDHHITLLKKHGSFNIVLVFDSDEAGKIAANKALDERFSKEKDFRIKLCQLPAGQDPDDLIRNEGFDAFVRLKKWTAFEWRMMQFMENFDEEDEDQRRNIAEKMVPIIVSEKNHMYQEDMAKQVAKMTGYDLTTVISEVKRQRNEKDAEVQTKKKNLIEALLTDVKRNPDDAEIALAQCQSAIYDINKSLQVENEESSTMTAIMSLKESDEKKTGEFAGFHLNPDGLGNIGARLDDDWKTDNLIFVGGSEQAGKTTFCAQMAYEIADDYANNAICIYHSIDDAKKFILYKWACNAAKDKRLTLNMTSNPNYWARQEGCEFVLPAREQAYRKLLKMIKNGQLVVKDASDGSSISYAESITRYYREMYPEKKIVLFVDNFHKLPDFAEINGHERVKRLSNHLKNMAVALGITIVSTVEYRKLQPGEKPTNLAIAESRSLAYDSSVILHLHNDMHHVGENEAVLVHYAEDGTPMPRIWCKFGKNKVSGYEGREFLNLYGANARLCGVPLDDAIQEQKERLAMLKENKANEMY